MIEKNISDGGACWEFYQEIRGIERKYQEASSEACGLRLMLEAWMSKPITNDEMNLLRMSPKYPMIRPEEAGRIMAKMREKTK